MINLARASVWLVSAGALAAAGVAGFCYQRVTRPAMPERPVSATAPASVEAWPSGERRSYRVSLESQVSIEAGELMGTSITGRLEATRVSRERLALALHFVPDHVVLRTSPADADELSSALTEPFGVELSPTGVIRTIGFVQAPKPEPAASLARGLLRTLVSAMQVSSPPAAAESWEAQERDVVGSYSARYSTHGPLLVDRTKAKYLTISAAQPLLSVRTELDSSLAHLRFFAAPLSPATLSGVELTETTHVVDEGPFPKLRSSMVLELALESREAVGSAGLTPLVEAFARLKQAAIDDRGDENRINIEHAKASGSGLAGLLADLSRVSPRDKAARARLFSQLKSHLRFDDASVREAERKIRSGDAQKDILIDALGSASSATAQLVLRGLVDDSRSNDADRRRALIALSFAETPSPETLEFLASLSDDPNYGTQALYGLGTAAYHLRDSDTDSARDVAASLSSGLSELSDPNEEVRLLKAVGNAGNAATLDDIAPYLSNPDAAVRGAAVWALRLIPSDRAEQGLALALVSDPVASVRLKALDAVAYRSATPVLIYAIQQSLLAETEVAVRRESVRAGMRWAKLAPGLTDALRQLAVSDPDQKVRELLREFAI